MGKGIYIGAIVVILVAIIGGSVWFYLEMSEPIDPEAGHVEVFIPTEDPTEATTKDTGIKIIGSGNGNSSGNTGNSSGNTTGGDVTDPGQQYVDTTQGGSGNTYTPPTQPSGEKNTTAAPSVTEKSGTYNGFSYHIDSSGHVSIKGYSGSGSINIPSTIENYPVVTIEASAFKDKSGITSISIPSSVQYINEMAFAGICRDGSISVNVPASVVSIGSGAFAGIRANISGNSAGYYSDGSGYVYWGDVLISSSGAPLHYSNQACKLPDGLSIIADGAFYKCSRLELIEIPRYVHMIGSMAFYGCSNLKSITLPEGITFVESATFASCDNLQTVFMNYVTDASMSKQYLFMSNAFPSNTKVYGVNMDIKLK